MMVKLQALSVTICEELYPKLCNKISNLTNIEIKLLENMTLYLVLLFYFEIIVAYL